MFGFMCTAAQASPIEAEPFLRPAFSCVFEHVSLFTLQSCVSTVLYLSLILFTGKKFLCFRCPESTVPKEVVWEVGGLWAPASLAS